MSKRGVWWDREGGERGVVAIAVPKSGLLKV